jgi:hypothetical protein
VKITNNTGINLPLAVWLLHDTYDYVDEENYISATSLMKPIRQTILGARVPVSERVTDISENIARSYGHAIHDSIESAWKTGHKKAMRLLGYPDTIVDRILINPTDEELRATSEAIPVYMEQRSFKKVLVNGVTYTIGGKYDMVADGELYDHKSTSAFSWLFGTRDDDHRTQGSIYRWLDEKRIYGSQIHINYIFTDWSRMQAKTNPKYPQKRVEEKHIDLWSVADTDRWVKERLSLIQKHWNSPESQIPFCTDKELWRSEPAYKYYRDPEKISGRSTKNFDNKHEAEQFKADKGGQGVVITVPGEAKACNYCNVFDLCKQKDGFI